MIVSVAFVGAGPTTIYTLYTLIAQARAPMAITIFEAQSAAGLGTPYRPGWNDAAMLSNIASVEIPPLEETLVDWLRRQPTEQLASFGIDPEAIDDRSFYPRLALGRYFLDQFNALVARARSFGHRIDINTYCQVEDIVAADRYMALTIKPRRAPSFEEQFDLVVIATGHQWPEDPESRPGYFLSPWPATALKRIPPTRIGIRGSSLTAIDAAVALATSNGAFVESDDGDLAFEPAPETGQFHMTMMSRKGLLPEADFFHPLPYEPLRYCNRAAIEQLIESCEDDLLDAAFDLFKRELFAADPDYATEIDLEALDLEAFGERFFRERSEADQFAWAAHNLAEAEANYATEYTVPWRYAILRMHEVFALLIPHIDDKEFQRFSRYFKPVFVDDYATVPHESIRRLLALHRTGKLDVLALGDGYRIDTHRPEGGATVTIDGDTRAFPIFIEATGQKALRAKDFPFPSLRRQHLIRDTDTVEGKPGSRGIVVDDEFHPVSDKAGSHRLFCLSLPFLLGRHPFIQGITSSHEMGEIVGKELADIVAGMTDGARETFVNQEAQRG